MTTARDTILHSLLRDVFPIWSSNRMSRWLGINPRTFQRMLKPDGDRNSQGVPQGLVDKLSDMRQRVQALDLETRFDAIIQDARAAGVDDEVIGAWIAGSHQKLLSRPLE